MSVLNLNPKVSDESDAAVPHIDTPQEAADRRWNEAFARTTPEQWARLEQLFRKEEVEGLMPLDFTER